jgi:hypothetical protein
MSMSGEFPFRLRVESLILSAHEEYCKAAPVSAVAKRIGSVASRVQTHRQERSLLTPPASVPICRYGDRNLVLSRRAGVRGGSGSLGRFRGVILLAGLKRSILGGGVSGISKERGAVGFTDLGGLLLNQLLTGGD